MLERVVGVGLRFRPSYFDNSKGHAAGILPLLQAMTVSGNCKMMPGVVGRKPVQRIAQQHKGNAHTLHGAARPRAAAAIDALTTQRDPWGQKMHDSLQRHVMCTTTLTPIVAQTHPQGAFRCSFGAQHVRREVKSKGRRGRGRGLLQRRGARAGVWEESRGGTNWLPSKCSAVLQIAFLAPCPPHL